MLTAGVPCRPAPTMKTTRQRLFTSCLLSALALGATGAARADVETYDIDPVHTWVGFTIRHFFTNVPGYFTQVKVTVVVDREQLTNSSVEVTIGVPSITTNTPKRDEDLRSDNFFAAVQYPAITFKSKRWERLESQLYAVSGDLSIKGVVKPVILKVRLTGFGPGMNGAAISGWEVSTTLDRRDFGVSADQGMIGNSVEVVIYVEADLRKTARAN